MKLSKRELSMHKLKGEHTWEWVRHLAKDIPYNQTTIDRDSIQPYERCSVCGVRKPKTARPDNYFEGTTIEINTPEITMDSIAKLCHEAYTVDGRSIERMILPASALRVLMNEINNQARYTTIPRSSVPERIEIINPVTAMPIQVEVREWQRDKIEDIAEKERKEAQFKEIMSKYG